MTTQTKPSDPLIRCAGQCGAGVEDIDAAQRAGWSLLHISMRWRCGACERALRAASGVVGEAAPTGDPLPADSIGALKHRGARPTADTIVIPYLKG